ncbi:hypothetical protein [Emticicia sp. 17c]|uniref:hypothetical protein n=1 Tax=Emticicia sp. 17c TaxID=3127704 RepID=UPI00301C0114
MKVSKVLFMAAVMLCSLTSKAQDVYEVIFTVGITQYRSALYMDWNEGIGKMRVRYFSDGNTRMVEQTMRVEKTTAGTRIAGYNPVYPGTSQRYPNYTADNFYVSQDEYGNISIVNVDDRNVAAACTVRKYNTYSEKQNFLRSFNWSL